MARRMSTKIGRGWEIFGDLEKTEKSLAFIVIQWYSVLATQLNTVPIGHTVGKNVCFAACSCLEADCVAAEANAAFFGARRAAHFFHFKG